MPSDAANRGRSASYPKSSARIIGCLSALLSLATTPTHALAQSVPKAAGKADVPCAVRAEQVRVAQLDKTEIRDAMRCVGDRQLVAARLWSKPITGAIELRALQDATIGYANPQLLSIVSRIAKSDPTDLRRFAAVGFLARLINKDISILPTDAPLWAVADSTQLTYPIGFSTHQGGQPSPETRDLAREQIEMLAKSADFLDVRRIARFLVQSSFMR